MTKTRETIDVEREQFVLHSERYWEIILAKQPGAAELANAETTAAQSIAERWAEKGRISDLLLPVLSYNSERARYGAAAVLLNYTASQEAIAKLRDLAANPRGMIAPTVKLLLMKKGIPLNP